MFHRVNRKLRLTDAGGRYLPDVRAAFDQLADATERLRDPEAKGMLIVSALSSLASTWLIPRLAGLRACWPDIDVRIDADDVSVDFIRDNVDVAIRYGQGTWDGLEAHKLFNEHYFPVCSPALAKRLKRPGDLRHHVLLHEADVQVDWKSWLQGAGVDGVDANRGSTFNHGDMVIAAAIAGYGVAMGRTPLVNDDLATGRLIKPFDFSLPSSWAHYLVYPVNHSQKPMMSYS